VTIVQQTTNESLNEKLEKLEEEIKEFDGKQRTTVYTLRLQRYMELKKRANLYKSALGIGIERLEGSLTELEGKVNKMLDLRKTITVHKDGSTTEKGKKDENEADTDQD